MIINVLSLKMLILLLFCRFWFLVCWFFGVCAKSESLAFCARFLYLAKLRYFCVTWATSVSSCFFLQSYRLQMYCFVLTSGSLSDRREEWRSLGSPRRALCREATVCVGRSSFRLACFLLSCFLVGSCIKRYLVTPVTSRLISVSTRLYYLRHLNTIFVSTTLNNKELIQCCNNISTKFFIFSIKYLLFEPIFFT